jgi:hypothetical protein
MVDRSGQFRVDLIENLTGVKIMATLKTQSTALANAIDKAKQAEAKPLQVTLDSVSVIENAETLKEFSTAVHASLLAKGWTEGSANAQRSKIRRILGTMAATDKKMIEAHGISNREQGTQLVIELAQEATNISDLYTALAPTKMEEPTESDAVGSDAESESLEPLESERKTLPQLLDQFEEIGRLNGYTMQELTDAALDRYTEIDVDQFDEAA